MTITAFVAARLFDGRDLREGQAVLVQDGRVARICAQAEVPQDVVRVAVTGGVLAPGFVDVQVNGGGGVMFNDDPSVETLARIARAHGRLGATCLLPTLITDTPEQTQRAIDATEAAIAVGVPGIGGLHLEGPHLSLARKGAHDPALIRSLEAEDLALLLAAARRLPVLKITLAPEAVMPTQIAALAEAGVIVSLGHSDCSFEQARSARMQGAVCVTHLWNAMSPLGSRAPGLVGAALADGGLSTGLIADLTHVHGDTIRLCMAAKIGPGQIFLVSDAMAPAGTDVTDFMLNGRRITRQGGKLTLPDGTLAGADLDLSTAVRNMTGLGVPLAHALAMATSIPAELVGLHAGRVKPGAAADLVHLDDDLRLKAVWRGGQPVALE